MYVIGSIFTYPINDIGAIGINKIIVFLIAGMLFELVFLIFKLEVKNIQVDIIAATAISSAIIPIIMGFLISFNIVTSMILSMINLVLLSFLVGLAGAVISFLIWYNLRTTKIVLKFEYMQ